MQSAKVTTSANTSSCFVEAAQYLELLEALTTTAAALTPLPDSIVGVKRSGLFPAVYISERLGLPMFASTELASFPFPRLCIPLIVDTTCWSGVSLRRITRRLEALGAAPVRSLVMYARREPFPDVPALSALKLADAVPRFWYTVQLGAAQ